MTQKSSKPKVPEFLYIEPSASLEDLNTVSSSIGRQLKMSVDATTRSLKDNEDLTE